MNLPAETDPAISLALAGKLFAAIEANDTDALRDEVYAPDVIVWHNNDNHEQHIDENLTGKRYEEVRRQATSTGFVEQHVLRGTTKNGTELNVFACLVVTVENGRIARIDEYLDGNAVTPLAG
jgi:uncharacterized protein